MNKEVSDSSLDADIIDSLLGAYMADPDGFIREAEHYSTRSQNILYVRDGRGNIVGYNVGKPAGSHHKNLNDYIYEVPKILH